MEKFQSVLDQRSPDDPYGPLGPAPQGGVPSSLFAPGAQSFQRSGRPDGDNPHGPFGPNPSIGTSGPYEPGGGTMPSGYGNPQTSNPGQTYGPPKPPSSSVTDAGGPASTVGATSPPPPPNNGSYFNDLGGGSNGGGSNGVGGGGNPNGSGQPSGNTNNNGTGGGSQNSTPQGSGSTTGGGGSDAGAANNGGGQVGNGGVGSSNNPADNQNPPSSPPPPPPSSTPFGPHPVILDLTGAGIKITELSTSTRFTDAGVDGKDHRTAWAGAGCAVLFFDADNSGGINAKREYVFTEWDPTAQGDLEAIRSVFDSNHDGKLDASDASFSQFKLEVVNADGSTTIKTLAQAGITSISLTPDATHIELPDGSMITGQATYTFSSPNPADHAYVLGDRPSNPYNPLGDPTNSGSLNTSTGYA